MGISLCSLGWVDEERNQRCAAEQEEDEETTGQRAIPMNEHVADDESSEKKSTVDLSFFFPFKTPSSTQRMGKWLSGKIAVDDMIGAFILSHQFDNHDRIIAMMRAQASQPRQ